MRNLITQLKQEAVELRVFKISLEGEIDMLKQIRTDLEDDIQRVIFNCVGKLQFEDLVRLWTNSVKSNLWTTLISQ